LIFCKNGCNLSPDPSAPRCCHHRFLSVEGSREIYLLGLWLNALGLTLTVRVKN